MGQCTYGGAPDANGATAEWDKQWRTTQLGAHPGAVGHHRNRAEIQRRRAELRGSRPIVSTGLGGEQCGDAEWNVQREGAVLYAFRRQRTGCGYCPRLSLTGAALYIC